MLSWQDPILVNSVFPLETTIGSVSVGVAQCVIHIGTSLSPLYSTYGAAPCK